MFFAGDEKGNPSLFVLSKTGIITKINGSDKIYSSPPYYGPDIVWMPGGYRFIFCNDDSIYKYDITKNELKRLTQNESDMDIQPSIENDGKIHFMRGVFCEFSFGGIEYMMNPDGSGVEKVPGGRLIKGESLRGDVDSR
jgi:hypothetical protein